MRSCTRRSIAACCAGVQRRVGHAVEIVQRQAEAPQHQPRGLVERVGRAVPKANARLVRGGRWCARSARSRSHVQQGLQACGGRCSSAARCSPASTCSSTLWMLALTGPNSITCGQMAMKRPSEVPPVVDSRARCRSRRGWPAQRLAQRARRREEGLAAQRPGQLVLEAMAVEQRVHARFSASGVDSVLKRKLKSSSASPGMTLVAPVPACTLDTCQLVGGKYSLPSSQAWRPARPAPAPARASGCAPAAGRRCGPARP